MKPRRSSDAAYATPAAKTQRQRARGMSFQFWRFPETPRVSFCTATIAERCGVNGENSRHAASYGETRWCRVRGRVAPLTRVPPPASSPPSTPSGGNIDVCVRGPISASDTLRCSPCDRKPRGFIRLFSAYSPVSVILISLSLSVFLFLSLEEDVVVRAGVAYTVSVKSISHVSNVKSSRTYAGLFEPWLARPPASRIRSTASWSSSSVAPPGRWRRPEHIAPAVATTPAAAVSAAVVAATWIWSCSRRVSLLSSL